MLKLTVKSSVELEGSQKPTTTLFAFISAESSVNVPVLILVESAAASDALAQTTPPDKSP